MKEWQGMALLALLAAAVVGLWLLQAMRAGDVRW